MRKLVYEIKDLKGYVLGIGYLNDKFLKEMEKNDYIAVNLLTNDINNATLKSMVDKEIRKKKKKGKTIYIKNLKKSFKKNKPDYIICNINDVENYLKYFVKDSLYITKQKIFIFSDKKKVNLSDIAKKYQRYIKNISINDEYIEIDTSNYHNNMFRNICFFITDTLSNFYDFIGNILTN